MGPRRSTRARRRHRTHHLHSPHRRPSSPAVDTSPARPPSAPSRRPRRPHTSPHRGRRPPPPEASRTVGSHAQTRERGNVAIVSPPLAEAPREACVGAANALVSTAPSVPSWPKRKGTPSPLAFAANSPLIAAFLAARKPRRTPDTLGAIASDARPRPLAHAPYDGSEKASTLVFPTR